MSEKITGEQLEAGSYDQRFPDYECRVCGCKYDEIDWDLPGLCNGCGEGLNKALCILEKGYKVALSVGMDNSKI